MQLDVTTKLGSGESGEATCESHYSNLPVEAAGKALIAF